MTSQRLQLGPDGVGILSADIDHDVVKDGDGNGETMERRREGKGVLIRVVRWRYRV
jgi:hypothetical protein